MTKTNNTITLFMENGINFTLTNEQVGNFEIEGIKETIRRLNDDFQEFVECEHFIIEIRENAIKNLDEFLSNAIVSIGIGKRLIYVPYEEEKENPSKNCFQEHYISKNNLIYLLISITKNLSDCHNIAMINDPGYIKYMFGGK